MATDDNKNAEQTSTFKDFVDKAIAHLSNLTRLEVNTLVGEYEFNKVKNIPTTIKQDSTNERMCTQINLITGDITTAMTPSTSALTVKRRAS